jgi:hypothetical protein
MQAAEKVRATFISYLLRDLESFAFTPQEAVNPQESV